MPMLEAKLDKLREFAEGFEGNIIEEGDPAIGIVTHGIPYQYVKEVLPEAGVLRLGMTWPLPDRMLREFCGAYEKVYVVEEGEPFIEEYALALGLECRAEGFTVGIAQLVDDVELRGLDGNLGGAAKRDLKLIGDHIKVG